MTQAEILAQFKRMSPTEQKALYKALQQIMENPSRQRVPKPDVSQHIEFSRGILRRAGVPPLTDAEVEQVLADSLLEDYFKLA